MGSGNRVPAQESRGGDKVDWSRAVPGEALPGEAIAYPEPDSEAVPSQDGHPLWPADEWTSTPEGQA